jgi:putative ABC transport system permease protein
MHDIRDAFRHLTHRRGLALTVILTLAMGIGANALVFSVLRAVVFKPLPFTQPDRLVALWQTQPPNALRSVAPANFLDWRASSSFEGLAAYDVRRKSLGGDIPERISIATVSANFFGVLGITPAVGRSFIETAGEGTVREVVLREDLWRRRFSADPSIVGRTIRLDDETLVVAGIVQVSVAFPEEAMAWTQARYDVPEVGGLVSPDIRRMRDARYFRVVGRLKPGITAAVAQAEMDSVAARLREMYPRDNRETGIQLVPLQEQLIARSRPMLWTLTAVAGCVLLIAAANVATLLLTAAIGRQRELAIRSALGASSLRLVRQLLTEAMLLSVAGTGLGLAVAAGAQPLLLALLPASTPRLGSVAIDAGVVGFAAVLCVLTAIVFGCAPAYVASRTRNFSTLRDGGRSGTSPSRNRTAAMLVAAQLAIAVVLVTGTGLMLRTLFSLYQRDIGIDVERLLALDVTVPDARSRGRAAAALDFERIADSLAHVPGVGAAGAIQALPLSSRGPAATIRVDGRAFGPNEAPDINWRTVTPGYFRAAGIELVRGRMFEDTDRAGSQPVAMINATLARMLWGDADPIGTRIGTGLDGDGAPIVIVGVVQDSAQESITAKVLPEMYRPLAQPSRFAADAMSFIVRTDGDPARLAAAATEVVRRVHPQAPVSSIRPMKVVASEGIAAEITVARALALFGALALMLSAVGLHGVVARMVGDRTRELGIRIALGARRGDLQKDVVGRTLRLTVSGLIAGIALSIAAGRQLGALLHGVSTADPLVLAVAALVLLLAAAVATFGPTRRALRTDPLIVMKGE